MAVDCLAWCTPTLSDEVIDQVGAVDFCDSRRHALGEPTRPAANLQNDVAGLRIQMFEEIVLEIAVEVEVLRSALVGGVEHLSKGIHLVARALPRQLTPQIFDHESSSE